MAGFLADRKGIGGGNRERGGDCSTRVAIARSGVWPKIIGANTGYTSTLRRIPKVGLAGFSLGVIAITISLRHTVKRSVSNKFLKQATEILGVSNNCIL